MAGIPWGLDSKNIPALGEFDLPLTNRGGILDLFVCVEVLQPSQPNGVMSSAVSLPNHKFSGQA